MVDRIVGETSRSTHDRKLTENAQHITLVRRRPGDRRGHHYRLCLARYSLAGGPGSEDGMAEPGLTKARICPRRAE